MTRELWKYGNLMQLDPKKPLNFPLGKLIMGLSHEPVKLPPHQLKLDYKTLLLKVTRDPNNIKSLKITTGGFCKLENPTLEMCSILSPQLNKENSSNTTYKELSHSMKNSNKVNSKHFFNKRKFSSELMSHLCENPNVAKQILQAQPYEDIIFKDRISKENETFFIDIFNDAFYRNNMFLYVEKDGKYYYATKIKVQNRKGMTSILGWTNKFGKINKVGEEDKARVYANIILRICLNLFEKNGVNYEVTYSDIIRVFKDEFKKDHKNFENGLEPFYRIERILNDGLFLFSSIETSF